MWASSSTTSIVFIIRSLPYFHKSPFLTISLSQEAPAVKLQLSHSIYLLKNIINIFPNTN
jgi:hypothetical protein